MDRVTSMRVFVHAASSGSLSAAARHLGISPAMATKHVNALESRLGVVRVWPVLHTTACIIGAKVVLLIICILPPGGFP